jgi:hypothetical protein
MSILDFDRIAGRMIRPDTILVDSFTRPSIVIGDLDKHA